jgi:hypothetical protein
MKFKFNRLIIVKLDLNKWLTIFVTTISLCSVAQAGPGDADLNPKDSALVEDSLMRMEGTFDLSDSGDFGHVRYNNIDLYIKVRDGIERLAVMNGFTFKRIDARGWGPKNLLNLSRNLGGHAYTHVFKSHWMPKPRLPSEYERAWLSPEFDVTKTIFWIEVPYDPSGSNASEMKLLVDAIYSALGSRNLVLDYLINRNSYLYIAAPDDFGAWDIRRHIDLISAARAPNFILLSETRKYVDCREFFEPLRTLKP